MTVNIDGIPVYYSDEGAGDCVLILEGWGTNLSLYAGISKHLSKSHRVITPDLPGFGRTPPPERAWEVKDYVQFIESFSVALGIERAILIGHSHGGRVAIRMAADENVRLRVPKIVLIDSAGIVHKKTPKQKLRLYTYKMGKKVLSSPPVKKLFPDVLEGLRKRMGSEDYRNAVPVMRQTLVNVISEDLREYMPKIKQPTLLIWGDRDTATPIEDAYIMEKLIPDSGLVTIKGAGHYSYLEQPVLVGRVLDSFLGVEQK
ncbi:MAG: alpha/beta hydrolase [Clostridiales bacterium]|nr:alpha/beta hydrolase [Clostridiales bacterium]